MKFKGLIISLLLPALLLSGCAEETPDSAGVDGIVAVSSAEEDPSAQSALPAEFALPYDPETSLDPITCPDGIQQTVGCLLYEGLFALDQALEPQPRLCSAAEYEPEAMTWILTLRPDVTFSDGSPLTAKDVSASLRRAMASPRYQARLSGIRSVSAEENTVTLSLLSPNTGLPALLDIPIVKAGTENLSVPLGTGPYHWVSGESGEYLAATADHWSGTPQPIDRIALVRCDDSEAARYQFTSHAVQLLSTDLTGTDPLSATGSFAFLDADTTVLQYVGLNLSRSLLSDAAVRQALSAGIDRESIAEAYLSGHALPAQFPVSPVSSLYPSEMETAYSHSSYVQRLEDAGLNSGNPRRLTLLVNQENAFKISVARYIASSLSAGDLTVEVKILPWSDYLSALSAREYDLFYGEARLTADWDLAPLVGTGGVLNPGGYTDPLTDQLLSAFAASPDRAYAMSALCSRLQRQAPILPVCFKRTSLLTQVGVAEGLSPTAADPFHGLENWRIYLAEN